MDNVGIPGMACERVRLVGDSIEELRAVALVARIVAAAPNRRFCLKRENRGSTN
jgi:hypothetical protein